MVRYSVEVKKGVDPEAMNAQLVSLARKHGKGAWTASDAMQLPGRQAFVDNNFHFDGKRGMKGDARFLAELPQGVRAGFVHAQDAEGNAYVVYSRGANLRCAKQRSELDEVVRQAALAYRAKQGGGEATRSSHFPRRSPCHRST